MSGWVGEERRRELTRSSERAAALLNAQDRLRALLLANAVAASERDLPAVLRHVAAGVRELVGARYAALAVMGPNRALAQFVQDGSEDDTVRTLAGLERGLTGVITHPDPVRVADLREHLGALGLPVGEQPMGSFLGVPIRYRDSVVGALYLIESTENGFTFQDEQLVTALATSAGVAIENARLHHESEQRLRWIEASAELTQQLFAQKTGRPLDLVLSYAAKVSEADTACLVVIEPDGRMRVHSAIGEAAGPMTGQFVDADNSIAGRVIEAGKPFLVQDYASEVRDSFTKVERLGAAIGVPLLAGDSVIGAVTVARLAERSPFVESDMDQLAGFANHAGVALELDRGRADRETLRLLVDHDRIAADLHDHVIQELFATGMGMQSMAQRVDGDDQREQLLRHADALDATIRRIRTTIFQLQQPASTPTVQA